MSTEMVHQDYRDLDDWPLEQSIAAIISSNRRALEALEQALPALTKAAEGIKLQLLKGGRLIYIGAGTSGRLAMQDAAELPPTFGFEKSLTLLAGGSTASSAAKEDAEDDELAAIAAVNQAQVGELDVLIGLAASGKTPYTVAGIKRARDLGAFTVGIANNAESPLLLAAEVAILLKTGPEVLAGSTRLAAGTAQKVVLNALSTSVLVSLGGAYKNFMVAMRPKNQKLKERAVVMLSQAAEITPERARASLEQSQWRIREAIIMVKANVSVEQAEVLLKKHHNRVREVLKEYCP